MPKLTRVAAVAAAVIAAGALAACSSSPASTTSHSGSTSKASASQPLNLYAAVGYDATVAKAFTAKTGIKVNVDDDSTGPLLTKITAEKNNPQWSLFWADGDTAFSSLDQQGLLASYQSSTVSYTSAGAALVPADHGYSPVATTAMAALIYNAAKVKAVPATYQDLLTAPYKGKVGMNDPAQSGPTFPFIAGVMNQLGGEQNGVKAGEDFFTKLKSNGLHVFPTNGDTLHALETGQIDYGMIQSSAAIGETIKVKPTANFDPKIVYLPKSTLLPSVIAIDKGAPAAVQKEAQQFVDYVLSPEGQAVMLTGDPSGDSLFWPIINGVTPLSQLPAFPSDFQTLDPKFWGPLEGQVNSWFDSNIK
ncbi:MAG: extracellular solute-binding protein [Microbacteriaceae bacterium]|nr:extracellular solute-binding protein [Microbacteriaceae bacterium]MCL2795596.1 extracellular solute-binding protein [Microbacteriaceae bacterium]